MPPGLRQNLMIIISAKNDVTGPLNSINKDITSVGQAVKGVAKAAGIGMAALGTAMVGMGVQAVKAFMGFETSMRNVYTLLPLTEEAFQSLSDQVLQLSQRVPQTAEDLGASLYDIISAGVTETSQAMNVLELSAKAAAAGMTDTASASKGAISIMNAFSMSAEDIPEIFDKMFSTVRVGVTTFPALSAQVGRMASQFSAAGASVEEMLGSLAFLTRIGLNTEQSVTRLAAAMTSLVKQKDLMEGFGAPVFDAQGKFRGLEVIVKDLNKAMSSLTSEEQLAKIQELIPEKEAAQAIQAMVQQYDKLSDSMSQVANSSGALQDASAKQLDSMSNRVKILQNTWDAFMINLGGSIATELTPALQNMTTSLSKNLTDNQNDVNEFFKNVINGAKWTAEKVIEFTNWLGEGAKKFGEMTAAGEQTKVMVLEGEKLRDVFRDITNAWWEERDIDKVDRLFSLWKDALPAEALTKLTSRVQFFHDVHKTAVEDATKNMAKFREGITKDMSNPVLQTTQDLDLWKLMLQELISLNSQLTDEQLKEANALLAKYQLTIEGAAKGTGDAAAATDNLGKALDNLNPKLEMTKTELRKTLQDMNRDLTVALQDQKTNLWDNYIYRLKLVNKGVRDGAVLEAEGARLAVSLWDDYHKKLRSISDIWSKYMIQLWSTTVDRVASGIGDAVADVLLSGKSFAEGMSDVILDIKRILISTIIEVAIKSLIAKALSGNIAAIALIVGGALASLNAMKRENTASGGSSAGAANRAGVPVMEEGGPVDHTGLHYLHQGEYVVPANQSQGGGMGGEMTVRLEGSPLYLNDQRAMDQLARALAPALSRINQRGS